MKTNFKKLFAIGITLASLAILSGCHTMAGLGKDVQQGGEALQQAASPENDGNLDSQY